MKTFKHEVKTIEEINGYQKALDAVYKYLAEVTQFNPVKRYVDAVDILDLIGNTNAELMQQLAAIGETIIEETFYKN